MPGTFPTGPTTVPFEKNSALVILKYDVVSDGEPLCRKEIFRPYNLWESVIYRNKLSFRRALGVQLLTGGHRDDCTSSKGQDSSGVASHVGVDGEGRVNPPLDDTARIGSQSKREIGGATEVTDAPAEFGVVKAIRGSNTGGQEGDGRVDIGPSALAEKKKFGNSGMEEF